jgi:hypothetical protein
LSGHFRESGSENFQENYGRLTDETISQDKCRWEPAWTECIAVGNKDFVGAIEEATVHRRRFQTEDLGSDARALRESARENGALEEKKPPEIRSKAKETSGTATNPFVPSEIECTDGYLCR